MPKLRNPRVVKIFFSSPFGGMEEEREELTRRYFPSIQHLCNSYGLQFAAVDMRWGITAESSDKAQVITICLRELDRSDMFIGFFGQRYGWHGADDDGLQKNFDNALPQYPWLDQFRDKSVTELEFLHGFLNNPGQLPTAIFFRDKGYDNMMREEGLGKGDKKQVFKYSAESELSTELMDDLKKRVWTHKDKSLGVHMDYKTPAEAAKIMYEIVMSYLKETLLVEYAEQKRYVREDLLSQHDAFLASRCNVFVHGETYIQQLAKQLLSEKSKNVVVTGGAGIGKSALLCNWIASLKQDSSSYAIVYHFIGFAENSTDVNSMLSRLSVEFEYILSKMTDGTAHLEDSSSSESRNTEDSSGESTVKLCQRLLTALDKLISLGKTPVLLLDGLDKIIITSKIKKVLFWLPSHFPSSVMVVVSTLESDTQNIEELIDRNYLRIHIDPPPSQFKHEMSVRTLRESGKELSPSQLERIVAAEMTKNPLFLKITLSELIAFGYFRLLDKKIDSLIASESTEALMQQVLTRLEEDYNVSSDYQGSLVELVMSGIQLSCQGLSETEVKEIFAIPDHVWSPFYFAIENLTINQSGRIQFGYKEFGEAVFARYLQDKDKRHFLMKKLVQYFTLELEQLSQSDFLAEEDLTICRPAYELPPLFLELGDLAQLAECLSNFFVFSHLAKNSPYLLVELWHHTGLKEEEIVDRLLSSFDKRIAEIYLRMEEQCVLGEHEPPGLRLVSFLTCVEHIMNIAGYATARKRVIKRAINIEEDALQNGKVTDLDNKKLFLINLKYRLACIYCESHLTAEDGIQLHKEISKHYESQMEASGQTSDLLTNLGHSSHGIGVGYATLDKYSDVEHYVTQSIKYHDESGVTSLSDMGASWSVLALCYMRNEEFEKALHYTEKALEAYETYHFGETPPIIGEMLTNKGLCLRKLGRLDEAEAVYQKSLAVKINAVGRQNEIVAMAYINLCALEFNRGKYPEGKLYAKQAVQIYETLGTARHNPKYIGAWENLILCLVMMESFAEADEDFMTVLNWRIEDGSMDQGLGSMYCNMARYYLREGMYEKAYQVTHTLLGSRFREDANCTTYILLDFACQNLPPTFKEQLTEEYTLAYAVEQHPDNVSLVKMMVEDHYVPSNNTEKIALAVNRLHSVSDMGAQVYVLSCMWCVNKEGKVNEKCQQTIIAEGLLKYPDDLDLNLNMAKSYRRLDQADLALPYALKVVEQQKDNAPLIMMTAHTAALAGECDICEQWCSYVLEHFDDESVKASANELLNMNKGVREHQQQQQQQEEQQQQQEQQATE